MRGQHPLGGRSPRATTHQFFSLPFRLGSGLMFFWFPADTARSLFEVPWSSTQPLRTHRDTQPPTHPSGLWSGSGTPSSTHWTPKPSVVVLCAAPPTPRAKSRTLVTGNHSPSRVWLLQGCRTKLGGLPCYLAALRAPGSLVTRELLLSGSHLDSVPSAARPGAGCPGRPPWPTPSSDDLCPAP